MTEIMESTPEEQAYHLGWSAPDDAKNPYDFGDDKEKALYERWEAGFINSGYTED